MVTQVVRHYQVSPFYLIQTPTWFPYLHRVLSPKELFIGLLQLQLQMLMFYGARNSNDY